MDKPPSFDSLSSDELAALAKDRGNPLRHEGKDTFLIPLNKHGRQMLAQLGKLPRSAQNRHR